jgi:hypothetical protein
MTVNEVAYFRVIDNFLDLGAGVPAPIIAGFQSLWLGADKAEADDLCWECGAGYGNNWCQRVTSPTLSYNGSGSVSLEFLYWSHSEPCYDGTQIYLQRADNTELLLNSYPAGECSDNTGYEGGTFTDSVGHYSNPETYSRDIGPGEIGGAQTIRIIFEFSSESEWSDEDCLYPTIWGGFGADNVSISGGGIGEWYDFETGLQGWSPGVCDPVGTFVDIVDVAAYTILDPCICRLESSIMEMHAGPPGEDGSHPVGQHIQCYSPIAWFGNTDPKNIFIEFDMYTILPQENGVLIRPGWIYYPWTCEATGVIGWSPRTGQNAYNYFGEDPVCATWRYGGTNLGGIAGEPVPPDVQGVIAVMELVGDCEALGIDPCSGETNETPLFDNLTCPTFAGTVWWFSVRSHHRRIPTRIGRRRCGGVSRSVRRFSRMWKATTASGKRASPTAETSTDPTILSLPGAGWTRSSSASW